MNRLIDDVCDALELIIGGLIVLFYFLGAIGIAALAVWSLVG